MIELDLSKDSIPLDLPMANSSIIKVIGVGGGGGNAVNHMYKQGIADVSFVVCNTDIQDLQRSPVPHKVSMGNLGAGGKPEVGRQAAEDSIDEIRKMLSDNTKMVFITAGMGGGTGTGASPVVAREAREMDILTVGIVTIPFAFEGNRKINQALQGIAELSAYVDALLIINNEKLRQIYPDLDLNNAFAKADDVLSNAARAIAEIITESGYINIDFADVNTIMREGKVAIMNTGYASGESRITKAIEDALTSPLLNTHDVRGARKVLLSLYCSTEHAIKMEEISQIHEFMENVGDDVDVIWGATFDEELGEDVKITLIATGFDVENIPGMPASILQSIEQQEEDDTPELTLDEFGQEVAPVEKKRVSDEEIHKAREQLYGKSSKQEPLEEEEEEGKAIEIEFGLEDEEEDDIPTIDIIDLSDEDDLHKSESIPTWKRISKKLIR